MAIKQKRCDICKKKRRFDEDRWQVEGWTSEVANYSGKKIHMHYCCPYCSKKLKN